MKKIIIHNFYGRNSPSGEDNFVRKRSKSQAVYAFSHLFYKSNRNHVTILIKFRRKFTNRIRRLINKNTVATEIEIHNINPLIDSKVVRELSACYSTNLFAHNFRLVAPCAVLMDRSGNPCTLCLRNRSALVLTPIWKCYRNSFLQTAILTLLIIRQSIFKHFHDVDVVTTFSNFHVQALRRLFGAKTKFKIIKNLDEQKLKAYNPSGHHSSVVYLGRLTREKGIIDLVEQWKEIRDIDLHIYGDGDFAEQLEKKCSKQANIFYHGYLDSSLFSQVLPQYSTLIIPSRCSEGFPTVINEAVSHNLNGITSNLSPQASHVSEIGGDVYEVNSTASLKSILQNRR